MLCPKTPAYEASSLKHRRSGNSGSKFRTMARSLMKSEMLALPFKFVGLRSVCPRFYISGNPCHQCDQRCKISSKTIATRPISYYNPAHIPGKSKQMKVSAGYRLAVVLLVLATTLYATSEGNSWNKVRYNGGTLQTKVDPKDWNNHLTVTSDTITLKLKDGQQVEIPTKSVTGLSYGQEAHRRVGTMIALGILVSPVALFGLMHKTRLHFIGIEYTMPDSKKAGLLLQGDKDNYRAILTALEGSTGAALSVSEKDREYVPGMPNVQTAHNDADAAKPGSAKGSSEKESSQQANSGKVRGKELGNDAPQIKPKPDAAESTSTTATTSTTPSAGTATIAVKSSPDNAEVSVDGNFMGNTPASLKLGAGKHTVKVSLAGYKDWSRDVTVSAGSEMNLSASLEKQ